jgi:DNA-binding beta-propeller fold protein YncE
MKKAVAAIACAAVALVAAAVATSADPPSAGTVVATFSMPTPRDARVGFGSLWIANGPSRTVTRVDPATGAVQAVIPVVRPASVLAAGAGSMWLTSFPGNTLTRIDPATNTVTGSISLGPSGDGPIGVTVAAGYVWVANHDGAPTTSVAKVDPESLSILDVIPVGTGTEAGPTKIVYGAGSLWVDVPSIPGVVRIDPATDAVTATIASKGSCADMAADDAAVWVANDGGQGCNPGYPGIARIDPATNAVAALVNGGGQTSALALDGTTLWYATTHTSFLGRVDTTTDAITALLKLPGPAFALAVAGGDVWATDAQDGLLFRIDPS